MRGISFDRHIRLIPQLWLSRDQRVDLVRRHFDFCLLMRASRSFENPPMRQRQLLFLLRGPIERHGNAFPREEGRSQMANRIDASADKCDQEDDKKDAKDQAALGETTRALPRRRELDPTL